MNGLAIVVGWCVIWFFVALLIAIPVGKFLGRKREAETEPDGWDPAPRRLTPLVPPQWQNEEHRDTGGS